jgi:hypothetical protein
MPIDCEFRATPLAGTGGCLATQSIWATIWVAALP